MEERLFNRLNISFVRTTIWRRLGNYIVVAPIVPQIIWTYLFPLAWSICSMKLLNRDRWTIQYFFVVFCLWDALDLRLNNNKKPKVSGTQIQRMKGNGIQQRPRIQVFDPICVTVTLFLFTCSWGFYFQTVLFTASQQRVVTHEEITSRGRNVVQW